ncbi:MAG: hypothetical protein ACX93T_00485 [Bacteroidota bacterium]
MRNKWTKLFFGLLGLELLGPELIKQFAKGMYSLKTDLRKWLLAWAIKVALLLLLFSLAQGAFLFGLGALALYINTLLSSSYQGFLIVSGGCMALLLLFWLLRRLR